MEHRTAEIAFNVEVGKMRFSHEHKSLADTVYLKNKREEMERYV
jgi:hypothetical protein